MIKKNIKEERKKTKAKSAKIIKSMEECEFKTFLKLLKKHKGVVHKTGDSFFVSYKDDYLVI